MSCVSVRLGWLLRLVGILNAPKARLRGSPASWVCIQKRCARGSKELRSTEACAPGTTSADAQRIKEPEKENRELRRANEILRKASAYFAQAEPGRR